MRIGTSPEEKIKVTLKSSSKSYNNYEFCNSSKDQHTQKQQRETQHLQLQNIKSSNSNNNKISQNQFKKNDLKFLDENHIAITKSSAVVQHKNKILNNKYNCYNIKTNSSNCCSQNGSLTNENISSATLKLKNTQNINSQNHFQNENSFSLVIDAGASKMIDNPITSAVYSATWSARNTNIKPSTTAMHKSNDDNNNNNHKICCQASPLTATAPITKEPLVTILSPKGHHYSATLQCIVKTIDSHKKPLGQQERENPNFHLSNAKAFSTEHYSPKTQRKNSSSLSAGPVSSSIITPKTGPEQQQQQQRKILQQSLLSDCSNSFHNLPKTQSTTARTKSSPNATATTSSSSLPIPLGNNVSSVNNPGNQEYGSKGGSGGGGKSHHFNRKKFWKLSSANSGGAVVIGAVANSSTSASLNNTSISDLPIANGSTNITGAATTESNVVINSIPTKPNNRNKNSNSRNNRYQQQSQSQYSEAWKKAAGMTTAVTSSVTNSSSTHTSQTLSTNANKPAAPEENVVAETMLTSSTNSTVTNTVGSSAAAAKSRAKREEKITLDASTITENIHVEKPQPLAPAHQQQHVQPTPLSPTKKRPYCDSDGSLNRNCPSGMPSYTLDFLHSVGKRMLAFGGSSFPTTTTTTTATSGNRAPLTSTNNNNNNSNATSQPQQTGHRSNRYASHSNNGYGHSNQHHHHHPQPQQLTIASFLQKDMFGTATNNARGVGNNNPGNSNNSNNNNTATNSGINSESSPHTYNNQMQYQHRFHGFYNHPPATSHYFRHQGMYQGYNGQNGMMPTNNPQRYHNSHNSNNNASSEHSQRQQQSSRNQQQRQNLVQQQYGGASHGNGNNNFAATTPNRKHKISGKHSKSPNLQNASSPSSSTSSLSSLASTASSHTGGGSRQSNGSNKSNPRPNSALDILPQKNNMYPVGPNAGNFRHNNHNRQHGGNHFNHHPGANAPPANAIMGQHQNFNNLTYVMTSGNGSEMGPPIAIPNMSGSNKATKIISASESSSRACSPSINACGENPNPEPSQPNRHVNPDQQAYINNNQKVHNVTTCQPIMNDDNKQEPNKANFSGHDCEDSEDPSSQHSEDGLHRCISFHQIRPTSSTSQSSHPANSQVPSPIEFAFNPVIQQMPPSTMHYPPQPYRNGMVQPVSNLPNNAFHEDDFHLHGAIQQQLPGMFFTSTDQLNSVNNNFPNPGNVIYSQSAMTLMPSCQSTASNLSRSSEDELQVVSSRSSSSSGSDQHKGSTPDISSDVANDMHDQMGGMNRNNMGANTLPSARSRSVRNQHSHSIPPPFMHYPFNQQSMFCSNYLAYLRSTPSNTSNDLNSNTPPDRFMSRSHLVEVKETPPTLLNNSKWDSLSQQIWSKFMDAQQTEETFKLKMRLWRYLYVTIKQTYPRYGLYLVGSTMSGFGADTSDVDMCLVSRSFAFVEQRMEALFNLTILRECLRKTEDFESFNLIEAKVPILRFRDKSNHFEVDLNFNNSVGIKNTHLLYCYTQLDWRLRPLALIVKLWAQYHDINNAKNMTISSYSLVLMVIHFLQCGVSPPVLPCLHKMFPEKFTPLRSHEFGHVDMNDNVGPYESKNTQALGELFMNFLEYYSSFDYRQNAISVRTGGLMPVNVCRQAKSLKNDIHQWKELCIEEPFDLTNTARSVYDFDTFERVKAVFSTSFQVLKKTLELNTIFAPLVLPRLPISARIYMKRTNLTNSSLISKVSDAADDNPQKNEIKDENIDSYNDQISSTISNLKDDQARIEEKTTAGRGDTTPATAAAL